MSNIIKFSINGDTNADQVTEKVKKSVSTLEKNMEGVQARFKNFGKDLFLSFAAPMVLLNSAMNMISSAIEKNRQKVEEAKALAEKGGNKYMREGTVTSAQEAARREQDAKDRENAKLGAVETARRQGEGQGYGNTSGKEAEAAMASYVEEGKGFWNTAGRFLETASMGLGLSDYAKNEDIQKILERRAAGRAANSPEAKAEAEAASAAAAQKAAAEAQIATKKQVDSMETTFKGPEGFGNVIGVGANPVLEAMNSQLEEQRTQSALLRQLVDANLVRGGTWMATPRTTP
jgi:flagellar motor protein MotB